MSADGIAYFISIFLFLSLHMIGGFTIAFHWKFLKRQSEIFSSAAPMLRIQNSACLRRLNKDLKILMLLSCMSAPADQLSWLAW
jgi:hypothetical protein